MIYLSPVGLATAPVANQLSIQAHIRERVCVCNSQSLINSPQVSINYTTGTPTLNGTTLFIPILAVITVVNNCGCGCNITPITFTENFIVSFQGYTSIPTSVTVNSLGKIEGSSVQCGKCYYDIYDSLTVVVTPAAAA